jgi:hypothetical protein
LDLSNQFRAPTSIVTTAFFSNSGLTFLMSINQDLQLALLEQLRFAPLALQVLAALLVSQPDCLLELRLVLVYLLNNDIDPGVNFIFLL